MDESFKCIHCQTTGDIPLFSEKALELSINLDLDSEH